MNKYLECMYEETENAKYPCFLSQCPFCAAADDEIYWIAEHFGFEPWEVGCFLCPCAQHLKVGFYLDERCMFGFEESCDVEGMKVWRKYKEFFDDNS